MAITKKRFYRRDERCPDIPRSTLAQRWGCSASYSLARQFFVAPFALIVPAVRRLPAFCRMRADAFGPHVEMAATDRAVPGAQGNTHSHCQWLFAMATVAVSGQSDAGRSK